MVWNLPTVIGALIIALILFLIFRGQFKKKGKGGCGCGCEGCANSAYCHPSSPDQKAAKHR